METLVQGHHLGGQAGRQAGRRAHSSAGVTQQVESLLLLADGVVVLHGLPSRGTSALLVNIQIDKQC
jgi:hypothetical protein